jgi:hypothetical protein
MARERRAGTQGHKLRGNGPWIPGLATRALKKRAPLARDTRLT